MKRFNLIILILFLIGCSEKNVDNSKENNKAYEKYKNLDVIMSIIDTGKEHLKLKTTEVCNDSDCDIYAIISSDVNNTKKGYKVKALPPSKNLIQSFVEIDIETNKILNILDESEAHTINNFEVNLDELKSRLKIRTYFELHKCRSVEIYESVVNYATNKDSFINLYFPLSFERVNHWNHIDKERIVLNFNLKNNSFNKISIIQSEKPTFSTRTWSNNEIDFAFIVWVPEELIKDKKLNFGKSFVQFSSDCGNAYRFMDKPYSSNEYYNAKDDIEPSKKMDDVISSHDIVYEKSYFHYLKDRSNFYTEGTNIIIPAYKEYLQFYLNIDDVLKEKIDEIY